MDTGQILWVAPFPLLSPDHFLFLFKFSNFQIFTIFSVFVNMGPYGSKNFKTLLLLFSSDLNQNEGIKSYVTYWRSTKNLNILWHFEILTCESMGKTKMCNILKTADRGAKGTKVGLGILHCT